MSRLTTISASLIATLATTSLGAAHGSNKWICGSVSGVPEYRISIDLDQGVAGFFDNDTTYRADLASARNGRYTFLGDSVQIKFDLNKLSASVTENFGTNQATTLKSEDGCQADDSVEL